MSKKIAKVWSLVFFVIMLFVEAISFYFIFVRVSDVRRGYTIYTWSFFEAERTKALGIFGTISAIAILSLVLFSKSIISRGQSVSINDKEKDDANLSDELQKLDDLKNKGIISQEEFDKIKEKAIEKYNA